MCPEKDKDLPDYWQEESEHSIVKSFAFSREPGNPDVCVCVCVKFQVYNFGSNLLLFSPLHGVGQTVKLWATNLQTFNLYKNLIPCIIWNVHCIDMLQKQSGKSGRPSQPSVEERASPIYTALKLKEVHHINQGDPFWKYFLQIATCFLTYE